eukprot:8829489-Pyramimonas_sp.AAC.1
MGCRRLYSSRKNNVYSSGMVAIGRSLASAPSGLQCCCRDPGEPASALCLRISAFRPLSLVSQPPGST